MRLIDADEMQEKAYKLNFDMRITSRELALINYLLAGTPTIEERKKGKWIDRGDYCVCNQCWHMEQQFNGVEPIPLRTPFCAICGADMREEKTDDLLHSDK